MIITLALKKTSNDGFVGKTIEKLIKWWTRSPYFHIEMIIKGKWISTNPTDGAVYIRELQDLKTNYDYIDIEIDGKKVKKAMVFLESQVGKKYDYLGLFFSTVIKFNLDNKQKWFCSELIAETLKIFDQPLREDSNNYTPGDLARIFRKQI